MRAVGWLFGGLFAQVYLLCAVVSWVIVRRSAALGQRFCGGWSRPVASELGLSLTGGLMGGLVVSLACQCLGWGPNAREGALLSMLALGASMLGAGPWSLPAAAVIVAWVARLWPAVVPPSEGFWPFIGLCQIMGGALWLLEQNGRGAVAVIEAQNPVGARLISRLWVLPVLGAGPYGGLQGSVPITIPMGMGFMAAGAPPRRVLASLAAFMALGGVVMLVLGLLPLNSLLRLAVMTAWVLLLGGADRLLMGRLHRTAPWAGQPDRGLRVLEVIPGSIGWRMGLRPGDVLEQVNDADIMQPQKLERLLRFLPGRVSLTWRRGERVMTGSHEDTYHGVEDLGLIFLPRDGAQTMPAHLPTWQLWFSSLPER